MSLSTDIFATLEIMAARRKKSKNSARSQIMTQLQSIVSAPNIVGFGAARKRMAGISSREQGVVFYVKKKKTRKLLRGDHLIPPVIAAGRSRAIFTDVVEVGRLDAHSHAQTNPIQAGFSIGHEDGKAGTLAAIVFKAGLPFALSAQHVFSNSDKASAGDRIIYPARADGGKLVNKIGTLEPYTSLIGGLSYPNTLDAALCKIDANATTRIDPSIITSPKHLKIKEPAVDMTVELKGRSSGKVQSTIRALNCYADFYHRGRGLIGFRGLVECDSFADGGDSGALVTEVNSGKAVGLHIGGSNAASFFVPIRTVADALGFAVV